MTMNIEYYVFTALINSNVYPQVRYQHYNREVYYTKRHEKVKRGEDGNGTKSFRRISVSFTKGKLKPNKTKRVSIRKQIIITRQNASK